MSMPRQIEPKKRSKQILPMFSMYELLTNLKANVIDKLVDWLSTDFLKQVTSSQAQSSAANEPQKSSISKQAAEKTEAPKTIVQPEKTQTQATIQPKPQPKETITPEPLPATNTGVSSAKKGNEDGNQRQQKPNLAKRPPEREPAKQSKQSPVKVQIQSSNTEKSIKDRIKPRDPNAVDNSKKPQSQREPREKKTASSYQPRPEKTTETKEGEEAEHMLDPEQKKALIEDPERQARLQALINKATNVDSDFIKA
jgi:hypothetical protein